MRNHGEGYSAATQAPFLLAAGLGQVDKKTLSQWLSQDRLYAQGYVRFIGMMLSKMRLPTTPGTTNVQWQVTDMLISALTNIRRELLFFEDVAERYGLDLETPWPGEGTFAPTTTTRGYLDLFMNAASPGASLLESMVVLWATEKCYYSAWHYALYSMSRPEQPGNKESKLADADGAALRRELITNWTSDEFRDFVLQLEALVDELASIEEEKNNLDEQKPRCVEIWKQVLWLEARFWPALEEQ